MSTTVAQELDELVADLVVVSVPGQERSLAQPYRLGTYQTASSLH